MRTIFPRWATRWQTCVGLSALIFAAPLARLSAAEEKGPKNSTILLIRHAEKPETGDGLTPAGQERANAYVRFFKELTIQGQSAKPTLLIATADSANSRRPRLTLEPLAKALGLPLEVRFRNKDYLSMVASLRTGQFDGKTTLICWHHGDMPEVLSALGADPLKVLPGGKWPSGEYDWLVELRYDAQGQLASAERVQEHLTAEAAAR